MNTNQNTNPVPGMDSLNIFLITYHCPTKSTNGAEKCSLGSIGGFWEKKEVGSVELEIHYPNHKC